MPYRLLTLAALILLTIPAAAQNDENQLTSAPWKGDPLSLTCGLNLGVRKVYLRVNGREGKTPFCSFQLRLLGKEETSQEIMRPVSAPAQLVYLGKKEVKENGNEWTQYSWVGRVDGYRIDVGHPVKAVGPDHVEIYKKYAFDFGPKKLPHTVVVISRNDNKEVIRYGLRDLSKYRDAKNDLLKDRVPFEPNALVGDVLVFLRDKFVQSRSANEKLEVLDRLDKFDRATLTMVEQTLLRARSDKDARVATRAKELCSKYAIFSAHEVKVMLEKLQTGNAKEAHATLVTLKKISSRLGKPGLNGLTKMLKRTDLSAETRKEAEALRVRVEAFVAERQRKIDEARKRRGASKKD